MKIKGVIFDMDGLLIDTEPLWRKAEIEIFATVGIHLTEADCKKTLGIGIYEAVLYWYQRQPWDNKSLLKVEKEIDELFLELALKDAVPMPGALDALNLFQSLSFPIAVASSSPVSLIEALTNKVEIGHYFQSFHSGMDEEYSKPNPAVYISAAKSLGISPKEGLAFEDSFNGLLAAKSARMATVSIPDADQFSETRFDIADFKLKSLSEFTQDHLTKLSNL